jgi:hypothetical protein
MPEKRSPDKWILPKKHTSDINRDLSSFQPRPYRSLLSTVPEKSTRNELDDSPELTTLRIAPLIVRRFSFGLAKPPANSIIRSN